jgi:glycine dehydrogenase subunit 1
VRLRALLEKTAKLEPAFASPIFDEFVVRLDSPVAPVLQALQAKGILGGFDPTPHYPELGHALLVCATETKTPSDLERYASSMAGILASRRAPTSVSNHPQSA